APATTIIYTLSLHDALPISWDARRVPDERGAAGDRPADGGRRRRGAALRGRGLRPRGGARIPAPPARPARGAGGDAPGPPARRRSEEHTSELQSQSNLVCRL